jgi:putative endonuclease
MSLAPAAQDAKRYGAQRPHPGNYLAAWLPLAAYAAHMPVPVPNDAATRRRQAERAGLRAELLAELMLRLKFYRILARRYKTPAGEIDLIARRGKRLAFVEVKLRRSQDAALEAITPRLRSRVRRAAELWMARHDRRGRWQPAFDVVVVLPGRWPRHLRDAFPFE